MSRGAVSTADYDIAGRKVNCFDSDFVFVERYRRIILFNLKLLNKFCSMILDK